MPRSAKARRMCFSFHELHCTQFLVVVPCVSILCPPRFGDAGEFVSFAKISWSTAGKLDSNSVYATSVEVRGVIWPSIRVVLYGSQWCLLLLVSKRLPMAFIPLPCSSNARLRDLYSG